jgi:hypothetical protein
LQQSFKALVQAVLGQAQTLGVQMRKEEFSKKEVFAKIRKKAMYFLLGLKLREGHVVADRSLRQKRCQLLTIKIQVGSLKYQTN